MNNAVYGKTRENLRNRIDVKLINNKKVYLKCTLKPNSMLQKIFDKNLVGIRKRKFSLKLNKPSYTGMCILKQCKILFYEIQFNYIKNRYENKTKLLFTDTGSLMHEIKTHNLYENFTSNKEMFDFSNYPTNSKYYDGLNKLVIGKTKNETEDAAIEEFFGLKSEMYLFLLDQDSEHKRAKSEQKCCGNNNSYQI